MKTVAIIQARMGSTRLPGKVMRQLPGGSVLAWVIRRVRACGMLDAVVVATSILPEDDVVAEEANCCGASVFRGDAENVLSRYCGAAQKYAAEVIVRVTADCPLYDPDILVAMLNRFSVDKGAIDYLSNGGESRYFPRGLDTEIFTRQALDLACCKADKPYELEHVTPYIYQHPVEFRLASYRNEIDLSAYRWTLDTPDDWKLIEAIYAALSDGERIFTTSEVLKLLKARPELVALNAHIRQKKLGE